MTLSKSDSQRIRDRAPMRKVVEFGFPIISEWTLVIDTATNGEQYGVNLVAPGTDSIVITADGSTSKIEIADAIAAAWNLDAGCAAAATAVSDGVDTVTFTAVDTTTTLLLEEDENAAKVTLTPTADVLADGDYTTLALGVPNGQWFCRRIRAVQQFGTTADWNIRGGADGVFVSGHEYFKVATLDSDLDTASPINKSFVDDDGWVTADENGDVHLLWYFSAGTDHVVYGEAVFEPMHTVQDEA